MNEYDVIIPTFPGGSSVTFTATFTPEKIERWNTCGKHVYHYGIIVESDHKDEYMVYNPSSTFARIKVPDSVMDTNSSNHSTMGSNDLLLFGKTKEETLIDMGTIAYGDIYVKNKLSKNIFDANQDATLSYVIGNA